ncbi:MAG TPA: tetratricopeptide repeat protein, partial [Myxococcales bacterium]|nr:tetratricopeptide repeat protein [Myxococcales bacterium]
GSAARRKAGEKALARIGKLAAVATRPEELSALARTAREIGHPELAARAYERVTALERDRHSVLAAGIAALDAYRAADRGDEALRLADLLVQRFPVERALLDRAEAIALAQGNAPLARRFGTLLIDAGATDAVSLGRQLDLELAAGDLAAALGVAERLAAASGDRRSQLTAANVAIWAGHPDTALRHLLSAARNGGIAEIGRALDLARALRNSAAVAELLTLRSRKAALSATQLAELAAALGSTEPPRTALAALHKYVASRPNDRTAWEGLAAAQEEGHDFAAALATRAEIDRRFGGSIEGAVREAKLQWALGRCSDALAALVRYADSATAANVEYWELLAEIAWHEEADETAIKAYSKLWQLGRIGGTGAERLLSLTRDAGRIDDVIRLGSTGWSRLRDPRLLLVGMDEAARAGRWHELQRMVDESEDAGATLAGISSYWLLRARLAEHTGAISDAVAAYGRAIQIDAKSTAARSGVIWLFTDRHDRPALSAALAQWAGDAPSDPGLWQAYAAGLEELGRENEALAFRQRELTIGDDPARTLAAYAPSRGAAALTLAQPNLLAGAEAAAESIGGVVLRKEGVFVRSEVEGTQLELRGTLSTFLSSDPLVEAPQSEKRVSARAAFPHLGGQTEVTAGVSLRRDRDVLQASVSRTQLLGTLGEARLETSLNEPADETVALRLHAVRTRVGGAVAISEGPFYQRLAFDWKAWSARDGSALGSGGATNVEVGWRFLRGEPELHVRVQGGWQRNTLTSGALPLALSTFAADRAAILPDHLALLGLGIGAARAVLGPLRLVGDVWVGSVFPPVRPAFRVQTGLAVAPFRNAELAFSAFAANDRWETGGNLGLNVSFLHRFGL